MRARLAVDAPMTDQHDTSVLVAAILENHPDHDRALKVWELVHHGDAKGVISVHTLAGIYSVLTRMPRPLRLEPELAWTAVKAATLKYEETKRSHFTVPKLSV